MKVCGYWVPNLEFPVLYIFVYNVANCWQVSDIPSETVEASILAD